MTPHADPRPSSLAAYLRQARARAEDILAKHPRSEGHADASCEICLTTYPCDAVSAAEDVIAISAKLHLGRPIPGEALLGPVGGSARAASRRTS